MDATEPSRPLGTMAAKSLQHRSSNSCRVVIAPGCDIICDIIIFVVPASCCKSLHVRLTEIFAPAIVDANRCVLLQALASAKSAFGQFEGLVPERVCWFKSSPQQIIAFEIKNCRAGKNDGSLYFQL